MIFNQIRKKTYKLKRTIIKYFSLQKKQLN